MNTPGDFWALLDAIEKQLPPTRAGLESLLNVSLEKARDGSERTYFVGKTVRPNPFGIPLSTISFHEATEEAPGHLTMELSALDASEEAVTAQFSRGYWVPPPPPSFGDAAGPAYAVDRPWGQLWFGFGPGAGATVRWVSFALGAHGSPGI
jgi:hypothetical protein